VKQVQVYIGMGSNQDKPLEQVRAALNALAHLAVDGDVEVSPLYQTKPVGPQDQPDFINAVAGFRTTLSATGLLHALFAIEKAQGRKRCGERWGPRTLDLDLLLYGDEIIDSSELNVPHPLIKDRAFVLAPLRDIAPGLFVPAQGYVSSLLECIKNPEVSRINAHP